MSRPCRTHRDDTKRTLTFVNDGDFISFRHLYTRCARESRSEREGRKDGKLTSHLEARADFGESRPCRTHRDDTKRTLTFVNDGDFISFRHHVFVKTSHSVAGGDGLWYGEDELEDVADSVTELGAKAFEDETLPRTKVRRPQLPRKRVLLTD
jgi:hypothetical protein